MDGIADTLADRQRPDALRLRIMLSILNCAYRTTQAPTRQQRQRLAACLGMTEVKVRKWFERKRTQDVLAMHAAGAAGCSMPRMGTAEGCTYSGGDDIRVVTAATPPYQILGACESWQRFCGFGLSELVGKTLSIVQGPLTDEDTVLALMDAVERHDPIKATLINYTKNGIPFRHTVDISPLPADAGFLCVSREVTTLIDQGVLRRAAPSPSLSLASSSAASPIDQTVPIVEPVPASQTVQLREQACATSSASATHHGDC